MDWLGGAQFVGGMRVFRAPDGRITRIGVDHVTYDSRGKPAWIGTRRLTYDRKGRMSHIGGDLIRLDSDGKPAWIGTAWGW